MPSVSIPVAAVAGVAGAAISSSGAQAAAKTQANAADQAAAAQLAQFNVTNSNLAPYRGIGAAAISPLEYGLGIGGSPGTAGALAGTASGSLIAPFNPTMADLSATPGYQFIKQQGLEATQNSFAAQGLGASGAAAKGAAGYAEGLAGTTYQQQFQNYWTNKQNALGALQNAVGTGQNAAAMTGGFGAQAVTAGNNALMTGAAAQAAGTVGAANALTGGLGGITNSSMLYALSQGGLYGGSGTSINGVGSAGAMPLTNGAMGYNSLFPA